MNAAAVESYEKPPRYADPVPIGDEVLVTVTAAGLHPSSERWPKAATTAARASSLSPPVAIPKPSTKPGPSAPTPPGPGPTPPSWCFCSSHGEPAHNHR